MAIKPLNIKGTAKTPEIIYSGGKGSIDIKGKSIPENHHTFYTPIFEWLEDFSLDAPDKTMVNVYLEYFNTSSSKVLLKIFKLLEEVSLKGKEVEIIWFYEEDDLDMKECGQDYSAMLNMPFKMIEVEGG